MSDPTPPTTPRDVFLAEWPRSKAQNEWIRIDGTTYTIKPADFAFGGTEWRMIVVTPDRQRHDILNEQHDSPEGLKSWVWSIGCDKPWPMNGETL